MHISRNWTHARLLLKPDGDNGGDDLTARTAGFQRLQDRYGEDTLGMARDLFAENYTTRRKNGELQSQITEIKAKLPTEGSKVLTVEEAQKWAAYQALGEPDKVKSLVEERSTLQGQLEAKVREVTLRKAAELSKFSYDALLDADVLTGAKGKKLSYEIREVDTNGEKAFVAFVKEGDVEKPLTTYAEENWKSLLPSLVVKEDTTTNRSSSFSYPNQHQGSGGGKAPTTPKAQTEATLNKAYAPPKATTT